MGVGGVDSVVGDSGRWGKVEEIGGRRRWSKGKR